MKKMSRVLVLVGMFMLVFGTMAFASEAGAEEEGVADLAKTFLALASGLGIAIAAFGGALGQGRGLAAALEGIARNPGASGNMFVPFILGMVFIESLVIYAFVIAFFLQGKI